MAATLLGAIKVLWDAAGGPSDRGLGSLWFEEAREGIDFPYAVLDQVKEDETLMDAENGKEVKSRWRVTIYDTGAAAAESLGGIIETAFDGKTLDVTSRILVRMTAVVYQPELDRTRSTDARRVYHVRVMVYAEWRKVVSNVP